MLLHNKTYLYSILDVNNIGFYWMILVYLVEIWTAPGKVILRKNELLEERQLVEVDDKNVSSTEDGHHYTQRAVVQQRDGVVQHPAPHKAKKHHEIQCRRQRGKRYTCQNMWHHWLHLQIIFQNACTLSYVYALPASPNRTVIRTFPAVFIAEDMRSLSPVINMMSFCRTSGEEAGELRLWTEVSKEEPSGVPLSPSHSESEISSSEPY